MAITGTPTTVGTYAFTVQATDDDGNTGSVDCSIHIFASGTEPTINIGCGDPPGGTVGIPYFHTFPVTGATGPTIYTIVVGALPAGLTLDPLTGEVTGTPTAPGVYTFSVEVSQ